MASRANSRRWLLRDLPWAFALFVWTAFAAAILSYFIDWSTIRREAAAQPQFNNAKKANNASDDEFYTGSIIVPTRRYDQCWAYMFDNRNGKMRDGGSVNCDEAEHRSAEKYPFEGAEMTRLREVGKAFRNRGN